MIIIATITITIAASDDHWKLFAIETINLRIETLCIIIIIIIHQQE